MASKVSIEEKFDAAVKAIASLPSDGPFQPSNELKLKMYGCYKQVTVGPCNVPRPSFWDVVNKAKWDAWSSLGRMDKEEAMALYVDEIGKFVEMMPQNAAVRDLTEKLNVYEWVDSSEMKSTTTKSTTKTSAAPSKASSSSSYGDESGSAKAHGDSGIECNGNDERLEASPGNNKRAPTTAIPEKSAIVVNVAPILKEVENSGDSSSTSFVVVNGRSDPSSASTSDASSVRENPHFGPADKDSTAEDSSDSPPPPSPLPPSLDPVSSQNHDVDNGSPTANAVAAGLIPRVNSFHSNTSPFNGVLLAGSTGIMRGSSGSSTIVNGNSHFDDDDGDDDDNDVDNQRQRDFRNNERYEDSIASEEVTRDTLLSLKRACSSKPSNDDVTSPVCPVFNSVVDSASGRLPDQSDSDDDDDEFCDSSNDLSPHETSPPTAAEVGATILSSSTPLEAASNVLQIFPRPPPHPEPTLPISTPHQEVYAIQSPVSTASMCSTDSDLYATPAVVTPDNDAVPRGQYGMEDSVEDATNILEREVKRLVETSLDQVEKVTCKATEVLGRKTNKEELNFPLANEIRARPRNADVAATKEAVTKSVTLPSEPSATTMAVVVRPKVPQTVSTTKTTSEKQSSPRPRRGPSTGATSSALPHEDKDEIRVLSDIEDVALRPSLRENDDHRQTRTRQISINSRQEEDDSSSSESSQSSSWSPTGGSRRRRRNFDDWPIRSGDDSFKSKSGGKKHRDSDTTSAGGRAVGVAPINSGGAPRGRGGHSTTSASRGRTTSNPPSSAGGAGGLPPPYPQQQQPVASAVNEQIAVALLRIQQDVSTLNARINTLETLFWSSSSRNGNGEPPTGMNAASALHGGGNNHHASGDSGLTPPSSASAMKPIATSILNWLFPGFSLRSVVFLLLWPILAKGAYLIVKALIGLALMKRRRFIDGHDDLPPL